MDEITLNNWQSLALWDAPDLDAPIEVVSQEMARRGVSLTKASDEGMSRGRRRRTVPNVWGQFHGRGQPRQGFLSTEIMRAVYIKSEVVRACVDTLIELLCGADWAVRPKDEEKSKWLRSNKPQEFQRQQQLIKWLENFFGRPNIQESLDSFHRLLVRDILIYDAGAYEVVTAEVDGRLWPLELGGMAGDTIEPDTDNSGFVIDYYQSYNVNHSVQFAPSELAYIKLNPVSWSPYGISPIETAYVSIGSDLNANNYNAAYFEKNGIPPALLAVMGLSKTEFTRLLSAMRSTSQDNPWNIHAFRAMRSQEGGPKQQTFEMIPLSQVSNQEMQFVELLTHVVRRITMMYRISPSQIGFTDEITGGIGSGVAETQGDLMQNKGVAPLLKKLSETHTQMVIENILENQDLEFKFFSPNTPAEQKEYEQDSQEVQLGVMTINEFRDKHGGRDPVGWGDEPNPQLPYYQSPNMPQPMGMPGQPQMGGVPQQGQLPPGRQPQTPQSRLPPSELTKTAAEKKIIIRF